MTISGGRTKQLDIFCHVTGFTSDFLSFIVLEHIRFFHRALQLCFSLSIRYWVVDFILNIKVLNDAILSVCSKKREVVPDLAPMLWHSFGTIAALLQEIISIYPAINPPNLTVSKHFY